MFFFHSLKLAQVLSGWLGCRRRIGIFLVVHELVLVILFVFFGIL